MSNNIDKRNLSTQSLEHIASFISKFISGQIHSELITTQDNIAYFNQHSVYFSNMIIFRINVKDKTFNGYVNNGGNYFGNYQDGEIFLMCQQGSKIATIPLP